MLDENQLMCLFADNIEQSFLPFPYRQLSRKLFAPWLSMGDAAGSNLREHPE